MRNMKARAMFISMLGVLAMLVAACGASSSGSTTGASSTYNFNYSPTTPSKTGGTVVIGDWESPDNLNPFLTTSVASVEVYNAIWDSCLIQLPNLSLGLAGFKPDQCTQVPTVANGGESADGLTTTLKIDPNDKWSDGTPITASDFAFMVSIGMDPNIDGIPPYSFMKSVTATDSTTLTIKWSSPFSDYLNAVSGLFPLPAESYPGTYVNGVYNTTAVQALESNPSFLTQFPKDNGAYTVKSFAPGNIVLQKNPNFHSNFFKGPYLDQIIFKGTSQKSVLIQAYKTGQYDKVEDFVMSDLPQFAGLGSQVNIAPQIGVEHLEFNVRPQALNAASNGGTSIFASANVRKAFIEAFNTCQANIAVAGIPDCNSPLYKTGELTAPPAADYNAAIQSPAFNPSDAQSLMQQAGFKLDANGKLTYPNTSTEVNITLVTTSGNPERDAYIHLLAAQLAQNLQIKTTVAEYPAGKLFGVFVNNGILSSGQYDISLFAYVFGSDPYLNLSTLVGTSNIPTAKNPGGGNYSGADDPAVDQILTTDGTTYVSEAQLNSDMAKVQQMLAQDYFYDPLFIRSSISLVKSTLGNYQQSPSSAGDDWNMNDWFTTATQSQ